MEHADITRISPVNTITANPLFTPKMPVICTGFTVRVDFPHSFPRKERQLRAGYPIHGIEIEEPPCRLPPML